MTIRVDRPGRDRVERSVFIARDEMLSPILGGVALSGTVSRQIAAERDEALHMRLVVELEEGHDLATELAAPGPDAAQKLFADELDRLVSRVTLAPFALPRITSIEAHVESLDRAGGLEIVRAMPDRLVARPGGTIGVTVDLEGPRDLRRRAVLSVEVPRDARPGRYLLFVGSSRAVDGKFGNLDEAVRRTATDAATYLDAIARRASNAVLEARLALPAEGIVARGGLFPALPTTAHLLMRSRPGGEKRMFRARFLAVSSAREDLRRPIEKVVVVPVRIADRHSRDENARTLETEP